MDELARRLVAGPETFAHALDAAKDLILLVGLSEAEIYQASFLDQRVLTPRTQGQWLPIRDVKQRIDPTIARDDAGYIFHVGHVGSTLISRLIGETKQALALREPLILRDLAQMLASGNQSDAPLRDPDISSTHTALVRRLLARTFRADQRAIVKATSFVSDIAPVLVAPGGRALFLYTSLSSYMTTILAGENSRRELQTVTKSRLVRLARRLADMPYTLDDLDEGEQIALGWATEMLSLHQAADAMPSDAVMWLDFDAFLAEPANGLHTIVEHFGLTLGADETARIFAGPLMHRYSKAPEYAYSSELRRRLQHQAAMDHGDQLRSGMAWLDLASRRYDGMASATIRARRA